MDVLINSMVRILLHCIHISNHHFVHFKYTIILFVSDTSIKLKRKEKKKKEAHEKMLNITIYQRNANQNHNEVSPHSGQNDHYQNNLQTINAGEGVEKREPSCTVGGNVN